MSEHTRAKVGGRIHFLVSRQWCFIFSAMTLLNFILDNDCSLFFYKHIIYAINVVNIDKR